MNEMEAFFPQGLSQHGVAKMLIAYCQTTSHCNIVCTQRCLGCCHCCLTHEKRHPGIADCVGKCLRRIGGKHENGGWQLRQEQIHMPSQCLVRQVCGTERY